ncbi:GTP-binding protein REM 1 isoform X1 [Dipodomys merriami]|uniref:GTP-binding protein REM 1 isoform X1 n=1 Tax=Dipodomys merriami TaxID=94247 RepID=UPI003855E640
MTLNTQQEAKTPLRRRASTPLPLSSRGNQPGRLCTAAPQSQHPRLSQSVSLNPPSRKPSPAPDGWSSESSDSEGSWEALYRVVLLGDPGVGKTSLASLFAGKQERDLHEQLGDVYERTLTVDGEDTTLVVMDTWEAEKLAGPRQRLRMAHPSPAGWKLEPGVMPAGGQRLCHRVLHRRPRQLRERLRAPHPAAPHTSCGPRAHHPCGQQGRPGPLQGSFCGRGPRLRRGVRLQIYRDFSHSAAQRGRALRGRGAPTALAPPGQCGRAAAPGPATPGQPGPARAAFPGSPDGPQRRPPGAESPLQVLSQSGRALRPRPGLAVRDAAGHRCLESEGAPGPGAWPEGPFAQRSEGRTAGPCSTQRGHT